MTPSATQPWPGAMLRVFVELVLRAVSVFGMRAVGLSGECHTDVIHGALARRENGTLKETKRRSANRHAHASAYTIATSTESFSGLSRESLFEQHENSHESRTRTNQDARHKAEHDERGVGQHSSHLVIVIPEAAQLLSGTYSSALKLSVPWIPALRFAAAGMTAALAAQVRDQTLA